MSQYDYLDLGVVEDLVDVYLATKQKKLTGFAGIFVVSFRAVAGDPDQLGTLIDVQRNKTLRNLASKAKKAGGTGWWKDGEPTGRHLQAAMLAYSPTPKRFVTWLDNQIAELGADQRG